MALSVKCEIKIAAGTLLIIWLENIDKKYTRFELVINLSNNSFMYTDELIFPTIKKMNTNVNNKK